MHADDDFRRLFARNHADNLRERTEISAAAHTGGQADDDFQFGAHFELSGGGKGSAGAADIEAVSDVFEADAVAVGAADNDRQASLDAAMHAPLPHPC